MATVQVSKSSGAVSIWRTYFVANEWNEIQTCRKTSLMFNIVTSMFFLSYVGCGNWATTDPYKNSRFDDPNQYNAPMSSMLRFALIGSVYLLTGESLVYWFSPAHRWVIGWLVLPAHRWATIGWLVFTCLQVGHWLIGFYLLTGETLVYWFYLLTGELLVDWFSPAYRWDIGWLVLLAH